MLKDSPIVKVENSMKQTGRGLLNSPGATNRKPNGIRLDRQQIQKRIIVMDF